MNTLTPDDWKWIDLIRKELFWRLDMTRNNHTVDNVNKRIDALDKLIEIAIEKCCHDWQAALDDGDNGQQCTKCKKRR